MTKLLEGFPLWFLKTPQGREMKQEAESELQGQREHAARVIATLTEESATTLPKLAAAKAAKKNELAELDARTRAVKREYLLAELAEMEANTRVQTGIGRQRAFLHDTAPGCLNDYLGELLQYLADLRRSNVVQADINMGGQLGHATLMQQQREEMDRRWKQSQRANEFYSMVRDIIDAVKSLMFQPITEEQAESEIKKYRKHIANGEKAAGIIMERR